MRVAVLFVLALVASGGAVAPTLAQTVSPMRAVVGSVEDHFIVRLMVANPGGSELVSIVNGYDAKFEPIAIRSTVRRFAMEPGAVRRLSVAVPFAGHASRKVRLCVESAPPSVRGTVLVKSRICGRFLGRRLQADRQ